MAMSVPTEKRWTADEARQINEANPAHWPRYEVIGGELLVTPAPRLLHQDAVLQMAALLRGHIDANGAGHTMIAPADIELEPDSTVSPDVFVIPLQNGRKPRNWRDVSALMLVVEVLSPSTARHDRVTKRDYFARNGVAEYWIVDLDARVVERWRLGDERPAVIEQTLIWDPTNSSEAFVLDVRHFFAEVLD
jgi:Uma2 family endonuclease